MWEPLFSKTAPSRYLMSDHCTAQARYRKRRTTDTPGLRLHSHIFTRRNLHRAISSLAFNDSSTPIPQYASFLSFSQGFLEPRLPLGSLSKVNGNIGSVLDLLMCKVVAKFAVRKPGPCLERYVCKVAALRQYLGWEQKLDQR